MFESIFEESIDLTKDAFYKLMKSLNDDEIRLNIMKIGKDWKICFNELLEQL